MIPRPATAADSLDARVEKLEICVAYQDQIIEDLNRSVTAEWVQIENLTLPVKHLVDRLSQVESGAAADPTDEPPPPHY